MRAAGVDADLRVLSTTSRRTCTGRAPRRPAFAATTRAIAPGSTTAATATASRSIASSSRRTSTRRSGSCVAPTFALNAIGGAVQPAAAAGPPIRQLTWQANLDYLSDAAGDVLEDRSQSGAVRHRVQQQRPGRAHCRRATTSGCPADFTISPGVVVPAGGYSTHTLSGQLHAGAAAQGVGTLSRLARFVLRRHPHLGGLQRPHRVLRERRRRAERHAELGEPAVTAISRAPRRRAPRGGADRAARLQQPDAVQSDRAAPLTSSARMRWEYIPGSELFVVYSDGRDTGRAGASRCCRTGRSR